jgi:hypothetical protein
LVPNGDGTYMELDPDGTPRGVWHWDDENEEWVFDEDIPFGKPNPATQDGITAMAAALALAALALFGVVVVRGKVENGGLRMEN